MCLAIPGQIVELVDDAHDIATVDFCGARRSVNLTLVRENGVGVGDWVLVHVGFALSVIDAEEAATTLRYLEMLGGEYTDELRQIAQSYDP